MYQVIFTAIPTSLGNREDIFYKKIDFLTKLPYIVSYFKSNLLNTKLLQLY